MGTPQEVEGLMVHNRIWFGLQFDDLESSVMSDSDESCVEQDVRPLQNQNL